MIVAKYQPVDIKAVLQNAGVTPVDQSRALARFARQQLAEAQETNRQSMGRVPEHHTFVDGARTDYVDGVRPNGVIVYEFELATDAVAYCEAALMEASPVLTGAYKRAHRVYADGVLVESAAQTAGAEEVILTSLVPYARKIEGGRGGKPQSSKAPDGVYQVVAAMAARRFGNAARIRFAFREPVGGASALQSWAGRNAAKKDGQSRQRQQFQKNVRQPAIVITFR